MMAHDSAAALADATDWHKSSYSGGQNSGCVEVGTAGEFVGVRDTTLGRMSPVLVFAKDSWESFIRNLPRYVDDATVSAQELALRASCTRQPKPGSEMDSDLLNWVRIDDEQNGCDDCVEIARLPQDGRAVRNPADGATGSVLYFTHNEWCAFVLGVDKGEFHLTASGRPKLIS